MNGSVRPGELVAFFSLTSYLMWPIMNLGFVINMFSQSKASGERLLEILEEEEKVHEHAGSFSINGTVEFQHVSLSYPNEEKKSLENISFSASKRKSSRFNRSNWSRQNKLNTAAHEVLRTNFRKNLS